VVALLVSLGLAACSDDDPDDDPDAGSRSATSARSGSVELEVVEVATNLDTVWALAWDGDDKLWYTERGGRLTQLGGRSVRVEGVVEQGEAGLMGLEFGPDGATYVMYSSARDNRVVRLAADGSQDVMVDGIEVAGVHDGGRIRLGPDGALYVSTGDAGDGDSAQRDGLNGKILRIALDGSGDVETFSKGRRNVQGLCFRADGLLFATEHGPDRGDEINRVIRGSDGGWPGTEGNGIQNYTPTIAPAGCVVYSDDLIPQWSGSLLFVTLKDESLRRLTFASDGSVEDEEVLYQGEYGRLRDIAVGPDGAVYLATSNKDGRGSPEQGDDRILKIAPAD
jgi:glucose/arabinose dehydrogenase